MDLIRYRELNSSEVKQILEDYIGLTDNQRLKLRQIDRLPFSIVKYQRPEPVKPIWRFTILFYWAFMLVSLLLAFPIKWILTGNRYYSVKSWQYRLYVFWTKKLGLS